MSTAIIPHGIRADPSEGSRSRVNSNFLGKDNYAAWSGKCQIQLTIHKVWDVVNGSRLCPVVPAETHNPEGTVVTNQVEIDTAQQRVQAYTDAFNKAAGIIAETISDSQIYAVRSILGNPILTWKKLQEKFERKSRAEFSSAQLELLNFQHQEAETADATIERYEGVIEHCQQQGVPTPDDLLQQMLLARPNDRYLTLKKIIQRSKDTMDLEDIYSGMRDDDSEYQSTHASPRPGTAAFAEAVRLEVEKAQILWVQKSNGGRPSGGRPAAAYTVCYCCGDKGHYAKDCPKPNSKCNFCKRTGHVESVCRTKKAAAEKTADPPQPSVSFFDGYSCVAELQTDSPPIFDFSSSPYVFGESMVGELEWCPRATSTNKEADPDIQAADSASTLKEAASASTIKEADPDIQEADSANKEEEAASTHQHFIMAANNIQTSPTDFLGDTGASHHIAHRLDYFSEIFPLPGIFKIHQVQGTVAVTHWGTIILEVDSSSGKKPLRLTNCLFIDSMRFNILSLQKLREAGFIPVYSEIQDKVIIKKRLQNGDLEQVALMSESSKGRLTLDCKILSTQLSTLPTLRMAEALSGSLSMNLLHRRLGHSGEAALHRLLHGNMAIGVSVKPGSKIDFCDSCQLGKLTRPPHPAVAFDHGTSYPLELVVVDLAGPVTPRSLGGKSYIMGVLDVFTRYSWVYFLSRKSDAGEKLKEWIAVAEHQSGQKLLHLRSDKGGEFTSHAFMAWLALHGVDQQTTPPDSPESNGMSERLNRTLQDKARTVMVAGALPGYLWGEVMQATNMLRNMTPARNMQCTPFEKWSGKKPDLTKLRVLGCKAFCQIDKHNRGGKFSPVAYEGALVNYSTTNPAYRVWDPLRHTVYDVAQPTFNEEAVPGWWRKANLAAEKDAEPLVFPNVVNEEPPAAAEVHFPDAAASAHFTPSASPASSTSGHVPAPALLTPAPAVQSSEQSPPASPSASFFPPLSPLPDESHLRRSSRMNRGVPPLRLAEMLVAATEETSDADPKTYKQAMKQPDAVLWREACKAEVDSLIDNKVFSVVDRPLNKPVITSKWIFKKKKGASGKVEKYKARVVARGFMQEEGVDYTETYSPTVRLESIRLMLAAAAANGWHMEQMDVTTAFLYAELEEEVYLESPEGMFEDQDMSGKVLRLWRALYGLKQAPRMWNIHIDKALGEFGLIRLTADFCVYAIYDGPDRVLLGLFVDDMFIIGAIFSKIEGVKQFLHSRFRMKDLGKAAYLLGMEIRRQPEGGILLLQEKYTREILFKFAAGNCRAVSTPLPPYSKLSMADSPQTPEARALMVDVPYRSTIGSLMYLAVCTRPDLSAAISSLSRFNADPGQAHWEAVQHVLRYLQGTAGEGIFYKLGSSTKIWGYSDSSHLTCPDTARSRGGYVFISADGAVSWRSTLHPTATLSSCESEYVALTAAAQEASYLRNLQLQMQGPSIPAVPICIYIDSQPALDLVNNPVYHSRSKHIQAKYHFVRDRVFVEKEIEVERVPSGQMGADMLTKHASVGVVRYNKKLVGMQ